jgi:hypothetical protein
MIEALRTGEPPGDRSIRPRIVSRSPGSSSFATRTRHGGSCSAPESAAVDSRQITSLRETLWHVTFPVAGNMLLLTRIVAERYV